MRGDGRRRAGDDDGAVTVEFGIVFPVFALLLAGMVAFGLIFTAQLTLQQAAREGVREYALTGDAGAASDAATGAATNLSGVGVAVGAACDPDDPAPNKGPTSVTTTYTFSFPLPFSPVENLPLSAEAVMKCGG